jgi:hypothetical protein
MIREWNPLTWPPSFSASLLSLIRHFTSEKPKGEILFPASFLCSLFLAAYGQVFIWYILPGLPLGFLALSSFLEGEYERLRDKRIANILLSIYMVLLLMFRFLVKLPSFIPLH